MSEIWKRFKSKTYGLALITMILGYTEANSELLRPVLHDWYGVVMFGLGLLMMLIREFTTGPVKDK